MSALVAIVTSIITTLLTIFGYRNLRILYYRDRFGFGAKERGDIRIVNSGGSDKVYIVAKSTRTRFWIHPKESLENIGYDSREDVESIDGNELVKEYPVYKDINLTY